MPSVSRAILCRLRLRPASPHAPPSSFSSRGPITSVRSGVCGVVPATAAHFAGSAVSFFLRLIGVLWCSSLLALANDAGGRPGRAGGGERTGEPPAFSYTENALGTAEGPLEQTAPLHHALHAAAGLLLPPGEECVPGKQTVLETKFFPKKWNTEAGSTTFRTCLRRDMHQGEAFAMHVSGGRVDMFFGSTSPRIACCSP